MSEEWVIVAELDDGTAAEIPVEGDEDTARWLLSDVCSGAFNWQDGQVLRALPAGRVRAAKAYRKATRDPLVP